MVVTALHFSIGIHKKVLRELHDLRKQMKERPAGGAAPSPARSPGANAPLRVPAAPAPVQPDPARPGNPYYAPTVPLAPTPTEPAKP